MRVTIEAIKRTERVSKKGKPFVSVGLLTDKYPGKWLSGFGSEDNADWAKGMSVEIETETNGEYLNFKPANGAPKKPDAIAKRELLQIRLSAEEKKAFTMAATFDGKKVSEWIRDRLRRDSRTELETLGQIVPFLVVSEEIEE